MNTTTSALERAKAFMEGESTKHPETLFAIVKSWAGEKYILVKGEFIINDHLEAHPDNVVVLCKNGVEYTLPAKRLVDTIVPKNPEIQVITVKIENDSVTSIEGVPAGHKVIILDDYVDGLDDDDSQIIDLEGKKYYHYADEYHHSPDGSSNPINRLDPANIQPV